MYDVLANALFACGCVGVASIGRSYDLHRASSELFIASLIWLIHL